MADYEVRIELLTEAERTTLIELGADLQPNALTFQRRLGEPEMRHIWRILVNLKNRTRDEDSHINFAMGDWFNQAEEWFGKGTVKDWIVEEEKLKFYRDHLLVLSGATLIQLQYLEHVIKRCCACLSLKGLKLTFSDLLSPDPRHRRQTLGRLKNALVDSEIFEPNFEARLSAFVKKRNRFIHHFWVDTFEKMSETGALSFVTLEQVKEFVSDLFRETTDLHEVFLGFYYAIGAKLAVREEAILERNAILREWSQYISAFLAVQRAKDENVSEIS